MLGDPADQVAGEAVGVDEAEALVRDLILGVGVLRKAAKGDVAAARELRERARVKLDVATETTPRVVLEDMSNEELERLRERLLRMAVRMNERAARAQARAEGAAAP